MRLEEGSTVTARTLGSRTAAVAAEATFREFRLAVPSLGS